MPSPEPEIAPARRAKRRRGGFCDQYRAPARGSRLVRDPHHLPALPWEALANVVAAAGLRCLALMGMRA